jgi:omega-amidase
MKRTEIKAGIVQFDVQRGHVQANVDTMKRRILGLADKGAQLVLLPEMCSTGFVHSRLSTLARTTPEVIEELTALAKVKKLVMIGSFPEKKGDRIFNTAYVIDRDGSVLNGYRKVHLFSPTGEHRVFQGGGKAVVSQTSLGPIGLMICYDLRFPELCRALCLKGARLIAVPAQWPAARVQHWDVLLKARAIENQLFVMGANRCGRDPGLEYGGHSCIISPRGEVLAKAGRRAVSLMATMDFDVIEKTRNQIPCLHERVPEAYD